jgi:uncharacterized membrane protein
MKKILLSALLAISFLLPVLSFAQTADRSYHYRSIDYGIRVNTDTTFDVEERQTYIFQGEYHAAERYIPLNKIDSITDISVRDADGTSYIYSSKELDKTDPKSWGRYTTYRKNGAQYIDWYYNAKDTEHTWIISYKVHGGISFLKDHDELYWNLFGEYDVPIDTVTAQVTIPQNNFSAVDLQSSIYVEPEFPSKKAIFNNTTFSFTATNIPAHGIVTIAAGWPQDLISQSAYWKDFFWIYMPYIISILVALGCLIYGFIYWYMTEKYHKGRGTIVPEYEPPQNLRPAMAEVLVKERITNRAWPATIVDLAVRGYLKITEEESNWNKIKKAFLIIFVALFTIPLSLTVIEGESPAAFFPLFVIIIVFIVVISRTKNISSRNYIIERLKDPVGDSTLEQYEKSFLAILGSRFSTSELKKAGNSTKRAMYQAMQDLKKELYSETEADTKAYEVPLSYRKYIGYGFIGVFIFAWLIGFLGNAAGSLFQGVSASYVVAFIICGLSVLFLTLFIKFNPRLSQEGHIMREKWLGFKLYLETAERYRMQNLTPEIFERYLPYAMIFGIEKKWVGAAHNTAYASSTGTGFSTSAFSSSFASSLSSAFASSGGGASGGGGGAGGGGGGGGGGAS